MATLEPEMVGHMGDILEVQSSALRYLKWTFDAAAPHLGRRVLDVGAGLGTMTEYAANRDRVLALEPEDAYFAALTRRFAERENVTTVKGDITNDAIVDSLRSYELDSAMSYNVFEHIEDDRHAFRNVFRILRKGGTFVCFVPAFMSVYGRWDAAAGHFRRYTREEIVAKAREAGFEIVAAYYMNLVGYFVWFLNGRVLRADKPAGGERMVRLYDATAVRFTRRLERRWHPPFGQSVLLVARRP